ncbi:Tc5 transposase DNA-binding domain [Popillia japonica]|uniref:Tc5 transposase DNA-binding domain n=1 Tax=Popillia japonica TaxID=7064 RepID=A0AAW1L5S1_POPJA
MSVVKRKPLSISEKVLIIRELQSGSPNFVISKRYDLPTSTISTIWRNREAILYAFENNRVNCKKLRKCNQTDINEALATWYNLQKSAGLPVNGIILKNQAEQFAKQMGYQDYRCSSSWIDRFKKRHNISYSKYKIEHSTCLNSANIISSNSNIIKSDTPIKAENVQVWVPKIEEESESEDSRCLSKCDVKPVTIEQADEALNTLTKFADLMHSTSSKVMLKLLSEVKDVLENVRNCNYGGVNTDDPLK